MNSIDVVINGAAAHTGANTLLALLQEREMALDAAFACAINNTFVPRPNWPVCPLAAGDRIDIVAPITGG